MKRNVKWIVFIFLGLSLLVGACAPMSASEDAMFMESAPMMADYDMVAEEPAMMAESEMMAEERGMPAGVGETARTVERMVVYNADMRIAVESPEDTMQTIIRLAEEAGGYVVSSNLFRTQTDRGSMPQANLRVRVPAGRLNSIMEEIKSLTPDPREDVLSENISGQDVTAEYTDLESRLRNLEAAEQALVQLMEQAQDPQDVLDVFGELTYYRGEIEIVKGRMRFLEESAALSALSVDIIAKRALQPIDIAGWQPQGTARRAVEALVEAAQFVGDALIWFGIFCLPFIIPLGVVIYFIVRFFRKRKAKKKAGKDEKEVINGNKDSQ